jgi:hypothetical protein
MAGVDGTGAEGAFGTGLVTIKDGAELDLNGFTVGNDLDLAGRGIGGSSGALNHRGDAKATVTGKVTLSAADTVIKSKGDLALTGGFEAGFTPSNGDPLTLMFDNIGDVTVSADMLLTQDTRLETATTESGEDTGALILGGNISSATSTLRSLMMAAMA